jgi:hypothetical protein
MAIDDGVRVIRQSVAGTDRGLRSVDGDGGEPPIGGSRSRADGCPVVALGHLAGVLHFLDVRGQKRELTARQLGTRHDLLLLFCGDDSWLREHFPRWGLRSAGGGTKIRTKRKS